MQYSHAAPPYGDSCAAGIDWLWVSGFGAKVIEEYHYVACSFLVCLVGGLEGARVHFVLPDGQPECLGMVC